MYVILIKILEKRGIKEIKYYVQLESQNRDAFSVIELSTVNERTRY